MMTTECFHHNSGVCFCWSDHTAPNRTEHVGEDQAKRGTEYLSHSKQLRIGAKRSPLFHSWLSGGSDSVSACWYQARLSHFTNEISNSLPQQGNNRAAVVSIHLCIVHRPWHWRSILDPLVDHAEYDKGEDIASRPASPTCASDTSKSP